MHRNTLALVCALGLGAGTFSCGDDSHPGQGQDGPAADARADAPVDAPSPDAPPPDAPRVDGLPSGAVCETDGGAACNDGLLCCQPCCTGVDPTCRRGANNDAGIGVGQCPLPDLTIDQGRLASELGIGATNFSPDGCSVMEGCVAAPGLRRLLHFSVVTPNIGSADLHFGDPANNPLFQYSQCHMHYHFAGYALYRLLDGQGAEVLQGRKRAFCLEDFEPQPNPPIPGPRTAVYDCNDQGISVGWEDTYYNGLTCQFMDITDVPGGTYTLEVTINPDRLIPELRYDNNVATTTVTIPPPSSNPSPTDPCSGLVEGDSRECGWTAGGTFSCTPGTVVRAGCGCGVGSCTGDTMVRICDGATPCFAPGLGQNDDCSSSSTCARVTFNCPASGQYTVLSAPYTNGDPNATCTVGHMP